MTSSSEGPFTLVAHPLIEHKLTLLRDRTTPSGQFRQLLREVGLLLAHEVLRDLPLEPVEIETPLAAMTARKLSGKKLCFVSILRAGNGLLDGLLELVPSARVGHIGLYRDPQSLRPVEYYAKLPADLARRLVVVVDPMLATGHSAAAAVARVRAEGAGEVRLLTLLAAPEGLDNFFRNHPEVPVFSAALDSHLDAHGYIVPGLGDAGDRLYGTK